MIVFESLVRKGENASIHFFFPFSNKYLYPVKKPNKKQINVFNSLPLNPDF